MRMRCPAVSSSPLYLASSPSIEASSRLICEMRVLGGIETLLGVLHAVVLDLDGGLHLGQLVHALAIDGPAAFFQRAFDALALGHGLDALGVDLLGARVELGLGRRRSRRQASRRSASRRASSSVSEVFLPAMPAWPLCAVVMRSCCSLMPRLRASIWSLKYFSISPVEPCAAAASLIELALVGVPAFALEQRRGLRQLAGWRWWRRYRR